MNSPTMNVTYKKVNKMLFITKMASLDAANKFKSIFVNNNMFDLQFMKK
jgi:hypothetical protein